MRRGTRRQWYQLDWRYVDDDFIYDTEWINILRQQWPRRRRGTRRHRPRSTPIMRALREFLSLWYRLLSSPRRAAILPILRHRVPIANAVADHLSRGPVDEVPVLELITGAAQGVRMGWSGSALHYEEHYHYQQLFPSRGGHVGRFEITNEAMSGLRVRGAVAREE